MRCFTGRPMREFTGAVFEGSVERTTMFLLAVLGILLTVVLAPGGWQWKVAGSALVILTYTTVTFGLRTYQFFNTFQRPINVIRQVQGIGLTASETFLVLRNPGYLRDNDLLNALLANVGCGSAAFLAESHQMRCSPEYASNSVSPGSCYQQSILIFRR